MWIIYTGKPVDVEIDNDHIHSFHSAFQIQIIVLSSNNFISLPLTSKQGVSSTIELSKGQYETKQKHLTL